MDVNVLHHDLLKLQKDVSFIKHLLEEDYELSDGAVDSLMKARETSKTDYICLDKKQDNIVFG